MDDILLLHQDKQTLELCTWQIAAYLQYLGWTLALDKCEFTPKQEIKFLGWLWCSPQLSLCMTSPMRSAMRDMVKQWMHLAQSNAIVTSKSLAGLIGSLNFLRAQIPRASLYLRTLHSALTSMVSSAGWTGSSRLPRAVLYELRFWWRNVAYNTPYTFAGRAATARLTSDACEDGWGAHVEVGSLQQHTRGRFYPSDHLSSSNQRETAAVLRGLIFFRNLLVDHDVHALTIQCDNLVTVYNLQRQGAGVALLDMTRKIFSILTKLDIRLHVQHIPGVEN